VGASSAAGDVLLFLHADARLPADAPVAIAAARATGRRWGRFDVTLDGRSSWLPVVAACMNVRSSATGICTGDQGMFVERALFDAVRGFPPIALMEDVALSARLRREAGPPARLRQHVVASGRRWDRHGAWRTVVAMWALRFAYWRGAAPDDLARRYYAMPPATLPDLHVFAKAPVAGRVKTRLARVVGDAEALRTYEAIAAHVVHVADAARHAGVVASVTLWGDPGSVPSAFDRWRAGRDIALREQQGDDLGARMRHALRTSLARGRPALVVGTDVPGYDVAYLARAAALLATHDAVAGPAEDGGYVLLGLARDVDAFSGVAWSSAGVMAATRANLAAARATWAELPALWDVDTHDDWRRWQDLAGAPCAAD
jgi:rSAM/selenodomain-associated transferase 1